MNDRQKQSKDYGLMIMWRVLAVLTIIQWLMLVIEENSVLYYVRTIMFHGMLLATVLAYLGHQLAGMIPRFPQIDETGNVIPVVIGLGLFVLFVFYYFMTINIANYYIRTYDNPIDREIIIVTDAMRVAWFLIIGVVLIVGSTNLFYLKIYFKGRDRQMEYLLEKIKTDAEKPLMVRKA